MSIKAEQLERWHVEAIRERLPEAYTGIANAMLNPGYAAMMRSVGPAFAFVKNETVLALAGLIDYTPTNRATIWCAYANDVKREFASLYIFMLRYLRMFPRRRLEAHISPEFPPSKRLVRLAGFKFEALKESFDGDGCDVEEWVLIRRAA